MLKTPSKELLDTVFHLIFVETLYGFSCHQAPLPALLRSKRKLRKAWVTGPRRQSTECRAGVCPEQRDCLTHHDLPLATPAFSLYPVRARALRMFSQASPDSLTKAVRARFLVESSLCFLSKDKRAPGGSNGSGPETSHPGSRGPSPSANPSVIDMEEAGSSETLAQEDWMGPHVLQKQGCKFVLT